VHRCVSGPLAHPHPNGSMYPREGPRSSNFVLPKLTNWQFFTKCVEMYSMCNEKSNMKKITLALLLVLTLPLLATSESTLSSIKRIYVGSMGQSDESERFRILLEGELNKVGFTSVDAAEKADGILTGAMSVRVYANKSTARATVVLKTPDGVHLWEKDFQPHPHLRGRDTVKLRAQDVAGTLRKDVLSAANHR
jgi:hypothetical protein